MVFSVGGTFDPPFVRIFFNVQTERFRGGGYRRSDDEDIPDGLSGDVSGGVCGPGGDPVREERCN